MRGNLMLLMAVVVSSSPNLGKFSGRMAKCRSHPTLVLKIGRSGSTQLMAWLKALVPECYFVAELNHMWIFPKSTCFQSVWRHNGTSHLNDCIKFKNGTMRNCCNQADCCPLPKPMRAHVNRNTLPFSDQMQRRYMAWLLRRGTVASIDIVGVGSGGFTVTPSGRKFLKHIVKEQQIKIVFLQRRNHLRAAISLWLAGKTDCWSGSCPGKKDFLPITLSSGMVAGKTHARMCSEATVEHIGQMLADMDVGKSLLKFDYEDLMSSPRESMQRLFEYIGLDDYIPRIKSFKFRIPREKHTVDFSRAFKNPSEVYQELRKWCHDWMWWGGSYSNITRPKLTWEECIAQARRQGREITPRAKPCNFKNKFKHLQQRYTLMQSNKFLSLKAKNVTKERQRWYPDR